MNVLLVAAVDAELSDLGGVPVGVGPLRAAHRAGMMFATNRPDAVVLVGSCGSYTPEIGIGDVVCSQTNLWASGVDALGLGYTPIPPPALPADAALIAASGLVVARVVTVPTITTDLTLAAALTQLGEVEHMEAYGVALAAAEAQIPFLAILGVSNQVGPGAHEDWKRHRATAEANAREAARRLVHKLSHQDRP